MLRLETEHRLGGLAVNVALDVAAGETLALAGPSGAGKTTVLRVIAGLLRPDRGRVQCESRIWLDTARGCWIPPEQRSCGYVFQDYALFPHLRAWQNVAYGVRGVERRVRRRRAEELLERFGVGWAAQSKPRELSGGERQRVALARALARAPRVLLLDEPLSALDARTRASASRELASVLRAAEVPAILVTHDFEDAALLGDNVAVLDGGTVVQSGPPAELAAAPASPFVADFTGATVLYGQARANGSGLTVVELEGGGCIASADVVHGRVAASVFPWEVTLEPAESAGGGSARNRLRASIVSVTRIGNRVRVGLATPQPLAAEVTGEAVRRMALEPGTAVVAVWKATATRLTAL